MIHANRMSFFLVLLEFTKWHHIKTLGKLFFHLSVMCSMSIRTPKCVPPARTARPKPNQRTYAHAARLYIKRGEAPARNVLLKALYQKPGTKPKRLNFRGPTTTMRDEVNDIVPELVEPIVMIDVQLRLYFFHPRDIETLVEGEQIQGYYLLQSARKKDGAPINEGDDTIVLFTVDYDTLQEYSPKPTPDEIANSLGGRRRRAYNVVRFEKADWSGLVAHLRASTAHESRSFIVDRVGRKYRMTTGRIYLTSI